MQFPLHFHDSEGMEKTGNAIWLSLFADDLSKSFGVSPVLDLFGEGNDVVQILTIVCTTSAVEIKIDPSNYYSLRAARIKRLDYYFLLITNTPTCWLEYTAF